MKQSIVYDLLAQIAGKLDFASSRRQAIEENREGYIKLDYHSGYGGWRVVEIKTESGAQYGALGTDDQHPRVSTNEMASRLKGILQGIELSKQLLTH